MADPPPVPLEAITDATAAVVTELHKMPGKRDERAEENIRRLAFDLATAAIDAAAPLIAGAVGEACAQLAEAEADKLRAGASPEWMAPAAGALEDFADLLRLDHHG